VVMVRAVAGTERPPVPVGRPIGPTPLENQMVAENNQTKEDASPPAVVAPDPIQRAREISAAVKRAGQHAGAARRGERLCRVLP
jgi:hypothetical protein